MPRPVVRGQRYQISPQATPVTPTRARRTWLETALIVGWIAAACLLAAGVGHVGW